jgi:OOP family OmpA-OmpF porin
VFFRFSEPPYITVSQITHRSVCFSTDGSGRFVRQNNNVLRLETMKTMKSIVILLSLLGNIALAQTGDAYFNKKEYRNAVLAYKKEALRDPSKYMNLAKSHFALQEFSESVEAWKLYTEKHSSADKTLANKWILTREDMPVKVENIGENINTSNQEIVPRISSDGNTLYFLSEDRTGGVGGEDIWYCEKKPDGTWGEAKNLYQLNTTSHEGILSISPDGNVAIVFGNYQGSFGGGDLFYAVKTPNGWTFPCNLGGTINTKGWESLAALAPDGKTLIFSSSSRTDGKGGSDLYVTTLTEKGWTTPKNLGATINTSMAEAYPYISADGKTMYFTSTGHFGFGGNDLFVSRRLDDSWTNWSEPENLGRYINTLSDDQDFSIPGSGIKGYMVRNDMPDGFGGSDIYTFYMPQKYRPEQVFNVYGRIYDEKDSNVLANIRFYDLETNQEVTKVTSDAHDGMYNVSLPKRKKYQVVIDMKGYLYFSAILDLTDPELYRKQESFYTRLQHKQSRLNELQAEIDRLNAELKKATESKSEDIQKAFDKVENILKEYQKALDDYNRTMTEAKYRWLEEEGESLNLRKDFQLQTAQVGATFELKNIFFDFGKATLRKDSEAELDKLYEIMAKSEIVIELGGHTDSIGSDEANLKLSQDRVNSVKAYLVSKGITEARLQAIGYGEKQPVATNSTEEGRAMNRRVEVKILKLTMDREGGEIVTEEDRKKKKDKKKEEEPVEEIAEKGNMLELLQKAAKNGGLPSGSSCNEKPNYYGNNNYRPSDKKDYFRNFGNFGTIDKNNYTLKSFNASLVNFRYKPVGYFTGAEVSFLSKKLTERAIQAYLISPDSIKGGLGYSSITNNQIGNSPFLFSLGYAAKVFVGKPASATEDKLFGHLSIPVGIKYLLVKDGFIVAPEIFYHINAWTSRTKRNGVFDDGAQHLSIGVNGRWNMFHAGLNFNAGPLVSFVGFRAGVSF